jgi:predicted GIY-YIG superfamily endonuclease
MTHSIYFINELGTDNYKIGITNNTTRRLRELQTANKRPLVIHGTIDCVDKKDSMNKEKLIHTILNRFNLSGEWFVLPGNVIDKLSQEFDFSQVEILGEM